jgi:hypothetical protein
MKKWGILFSIFVCLVLIFAINCKSPATSEAASPFIAAEKETDAGSNSGSGEAGESSGGTTTAFGSLKVMLKDKPVDDAEHVWVTISNLVVHMADPDEFIEISNEEQKFDLLWLRDNTAVLDVSTLEVGHYNQIRADVVEGSIVFLEDDGRGGFEEKTYDLKIPSGEIKVPVQFYIQENGTTEVVLDFDAEKSVKITKQGKQDIYKLRPVVNAVSVSYQ